MNAHAFIRHFHANPVVANARVARMQASGRNPGRRIAVRSPFPDSAALHPGYVVGAAKAHTFIRHSRARPYTRGTPFTVIPAQAGIHAHPVVANERVARMQASGRNPGRRIAVRRLFPDSAALHPGYVIRAAKAHTFIRHSRTHGNDDQDAGRTHGLRRKPERTGGAS